MGCSPRHVFWNLLLVGGPAIVAVGVPQVQVRGPANVRFATRNAPTPHPRRKQRIPCSHPQVVFGFLGSIISTRASPRRARSPLSSNPAPPPPPPPAVKIYVFPALMLLAWARQLDRAGAGSDAEDAQALLLPQAAAAHGASAGRLVPASVLPEGSPEPGDGERGAALGEKSRLVQPLPPPQAQRQSSASFSSSSASRQPAGDAQGTGRLPEFLPRSPFWLRVHACLLLTLATAVAVIGTAANIYYA